MGRAPSHNTTVVVIRDGGFWRDRIRRYRVKLDGKVVGHLSEYEDIAIPVEAGPHDVQVKLDWGSSPTVTVNVEPGSSVRLRCSPGSVLGMIVPGMYLCLETEREITENGPVDPPTEEGSEL